MWDVYVTFQLIDLFKILFDFPLPSTGAGWIMVLCLVPAIFLALYIALELK